MRDVGNCRSLANGKPVSAGQGPIFDQILPQASVNELLHCIGHNVGVSDWSEYNSRIGKPNKKGRICAIQLQRVNRVLGDPYSSVQIELQFGQIRHHMGKPDPITIPLHKGAKPVTQDAFGLAELPGQGLL